MTLSSSRNRSMVLSPGLIALAWVVTLYISDLTTILWQELLGGVPSWLFMSKVGLLAAMLVVSLAWHVVRPLRDYFVIFLVIALTAQGSILLADTFWWQSRFGATDASFAVTMLGVQLRRVAVSLAVIATFLLLRYRRGDFFLVKGQLDATGAPIRWLGITRPYSYQRFGPLAALCLCLGLLVFLIVAGGWPPLSLSSLSVAMVGAVLVLAALNAFNENVGYRAAPLATLQPAVGPQQAMLLAAVFFGVGHFYGVPYGIVGATMATVLGWLLNKTMLETRGLFWPWFIHFCQDALVFTFMAMGAVSAGG